MMNDKPLCVAMTIPASFGLSACSSRVRLSGSAMIEFALLLLVMVPLFIGIPMIGKLIDLRQTNEQAARYAAWESTVYPQNALVDGKPYAVKQRFYSDASHVLSSQASDAGVNALWGEKQDSDPAGWINEGQIQIDQESANARPFDRNISSPTIAMSIGQQAGRAGEILDGLSGNSWGLTSDGLLRAGVGVNVKSNGWLTSGLQSCADEDVFACTSSTSAIVVDGWSASSDDQARRRVRSLMPSSALEPLGNAVSLVGHLPVFKELKLLDGAFGHVDMTVLPEYAKP